MFAGDGEGLAEALDSVAFAFASVGFVQAFVGLQANMITNVNEQKHTSMNDMRSRRRCNITSIWPVCVRMYVLVCECRYR